MNWGPHSMLNCVIVVIEAPLLVCVSKYSGRTCGGNCIKVHCYVIMMCTGCTWCTVRVSDIC
jgi:hypothetical protein